MGCCGDPVDKNAPSNQPKAHPHGMVTTQPTAQPILEKPGLSQTSSPPPTSPPPVFVNTGSVNGFNGAAAPPWVQAPTPPVHNPYELGLSVSPPIPSPSPGLTTYSYQSNGPADTLQRPHTVYYPTLNGPMPSPPPIDLSNVSVPNEGKMSISVDFGVC